MDNMQKIKMMIDTAKRYVRPVPKSEHIPDEYKDDKIYMNVENGSVYIKAVNGACFIQLKLEGVIGIPDGTYCFGATTKTNNITIENIKYYRFDFVNSNIEKFNLEDLVHVEGVAQAPIYKGEITGGFKIRFPYVLLPVSELHKGIKFLKPIWKRDPANAIGIQVKDGEFLMVAKSSEAGMGTFVSELSDLGHAQENYRPRNPQYINATYLDLLVNSVNKINPKENIMVYFLEGECVHITTTLAYNSIYFYAVLSLYMFT